MVTHSNILVQFCTLYCESDHVLGIREVMWMPYYNLRSLLTLILIHTLLILFMGFSRQEYWSGLPFLPDHLTCLLRNLCGGQQQLELVMEQQCGSKLGEEYVKAVYCHPAYLTYMQSTSCEALGWMKHKLESWTVVLEKTLESPLDFKEIQPVHPKGNQSWIFIGRTDGEAETPILWPPDGKNWLIGKDPNAGKVCRWEEKGMTEDEVVGWYHQLNGREFE